MVANSVIVLSKLMKDASPISGNRTRPRWNPAPLLVCRHGLARTGAPDSESN